MVFYSNASCFIVKNMSGGWGLSDVQRGELGPVSGVVGLVPGLCTMTPPPSPGANRNHYLPTTSLADGNLNISYSWCPEMYDSFKILTVQGEVVIDAFASDPSSLEVGAKKTIITFAPDDLFNVINEFIAIGLCVFVFANIPTCRVQPSL